MERDIQVEAIRTLLLRCLMADATDELLLICDESMEPFWEAFETAVESQSISASAIFMSRSYQRYMIRRSGSRGINDKVELPSGLVAAISASTAILNVLDGAADNAPVRKAVNQVLRPSNCRLATIPGINAQVLNAIKEAPITDITQSCELVAWMLGEAQSAEIVTTDSLKHEYLLSLDLGGWDSEPIMSPGILLPGSWGNVPPGETFCCPPPHTVNGEICINGSFRGSVLQRGEEAVLRFVSGKLVEWRPIASNSEFRAGNFFNNLKSSSISRGDLNWNTFAELGVGLNPRIQELTGNSLFDEKACNTIHVAIGDNSVFGDDVSSSIHEDLVTWYPSLRLNGKEVMHFGKIDKAQIERIRNQGLDQFPEMLAPGATIYLREGRIGYHQGKLMRRLSKAQRVNYVEMVPPALLGPLTEVYEKLKTYGNISLAAFLNNNPEFSGISTARLLDTLYHYRTLAISEVVPRGGRTFGFDGEST